MRICTAGEYAVRQQYAREENPQDSGRASVSIRMLHDWDSPSAILALGFGHPARRFAFAERPGVGRRPQTWK